MSESSKGYFYTDWAAMTGTDWFGLITVITLAALMAYVYFWVFRPKNRSKIEAHRDFVLKEDSIDGEDHRHGRA